MGINCFKGSGFPFKVMKIFWNDIKWLLHVINELNATELLTLKCSLNNNNNNKSVRIFLNFLFYIGV